jgi:hypothetical protein
LAELDYLTYIKEKIAKEMAKTAAIALKIRDSELAEQAKRNEKTRKEFNEQYESYISATTKMSVGLVDNRDTNIAGTLSKITQSIINQARQMWIEQQQAFAFLVANRLSQPIKLSNGQTLTASEKGVKEIQKNLSELPPPPDDTDAYTQGRHQLYEHHIAKYNNAPTIDEVIDARIQVAKQCNDAGRRAQRERMIIAKGLRNDFNFTPNHHANQAIEKCALEIVDEVRIRQFEQLVKLLIISATLTERLNNPRLMHDKFNETLSRHGFNDDAAQNRRGLR